MAKRNFKRGFSAFWNIEFGEDKERCFWGGAPFESFSGMKIRSNDYANMKVKIEKKAAYLIL